MSAARVLAALIRVHNRDGRATVRAVAAEAGIKYTGRVQRDLRVLRNEGLASWDVCTCGYPIVARMSLQCQEVMDFKWPDWRQQEIRTMAEVPQ